MRRSPETLIKGLRNRKHRIVAYSIWSVVSLCLLVAALFLLFKATSGLVPKESDDLQLHVIMGQQMLVGITFIEAMSLLIGLCVGASIGLLVGEVATFTKNDLLVNLWDRVQALEQSQPTPSDP